MLSGPATAAPAPGALAPRSRPAEAAVVTPGGTSVPGEGAVPGGGAALAGGLAPAVAVAPAGGPAQAGGRRIRRCGQSCAAAVRPGG